MKRFDLDKLMDNLPTFVYDGKEFKTKILQAGEKLKNTKFIMTTGTDGITITKQHIGLSLNQLARQTIETIEKEEREFAAIYAEFLKDRLVKGNPDDITPEWVMQMPGQVKEIIDDILKYGESPKLNDAEGNES